MFNANIFKAISRKLTINVMYYLVKYSRIILSETLFIGIITVTIFLVVNKVNASRVDVRVRLDIKIFSC